MVKREALESFFKCIQRRSICSGRELFSGKHRGFIGVSRPDGRASARFSGTWNFLKDKKL